MVGSRARAVPCMITTIKREVSFWIVIEGSGFNGKYNVLP